MLVRVDLAVQVVHLVQQLVYVRPDDLILLLDLVDFLRLLLQF